MFYFLSQLINSKCMEHHFEAVCTSCIHVIQVIHPGVISLEVPLLRSLMTHFDVL